MAVAEALGLGERGRYLAAMTFGNVHGVYKPGNVKLRPEILKEIQDAVGAKYGKEKPFDLVFHGGSGSLESEISAAVDHGVVKMNVDTDTQYAFTRPVVGPHVHELRRRAEGRRRGRQQEGLRPAHLGQGRRDRHDRPRRPGLPGPALRRHPDRLTHADRMSGENLLGAAVGVGVPQTRLPDDAVAREALDAGAPAGQVAAADPATSLPWAVLAEQALDGGRAVEAYAYARTGYHRGLDALRRAGWRGQGPVPWEHVPNRGFLRALAALSRAAAAIGERDEQERCATFLADCDPQAARELGLA